MTNNNPNEPRMLSDAELAGVAGGAGFWSSAMEEEYQHAYNELGGTGPFRDWMLGMCHDEDILKARDAWLAADKPAGGMIYMDDGTTQLV